MLTPILLGITLKKGHKREWRKAKPPTLCRRYRADLDQLDEAELSAASQKVDLKIDIAKTQFMTNLVSSCNLMLEGK